MGYIEELRELVGHRPVIFVGSVTIIVDEMDESLSKHYMDEWKPNR